MSSVTFSDIQAAQRRIADYVQHTPIVTSGLLNQWLGQQIYFKAECLQHTGAFKIRGALNTLLRAREQGKDIHRVVASSSGNHAQAVAYAASLFGLETKIFSTQNVSGVKASATRFYGAELALYANRDEADEAVALAAESDGTLWIPPFNHIDVIAGQGTVALEAFHQVPNVDALVMPCGGGGLASGSLIASRGMSADTQVIAAEPLAANDAAQSLRSGRIERLTHSSNTLADGAATPAVGTLTFEFLKQLDGFYEVTETQIAYWTQWLQHLLKLHIEPTAALSMGAVMNWLQQQNQPQRVLVVLSGGNIDQQKMQQVWQHDHLVNPPSLSPNR